MSQGNHKLDPTESVPIVGCPCVVTNYFVYGDAEAIDAHLYFKDERMYLPKYPGPSFPFQWQGRFVVITQCQTCRRHTFHVYDGNGRWHTIKPTGWRKRYSFFWNHLHNEVRTLDTLQSVHWKGLYRSRHVELLRGTGADRMLIEILSVTGLLNAYLGLIDCDPWYFPGKTMRLHMYVADGNIPFHLPHRFRNEVARVQRLAAALQEAVDGLVAHKDVCRSSELAELRGTLENVLYETGFKQDRAHTN